MSACGNCEHEDPHGRKGHGGCSHQDLTDAGREAVESLKDSPRAILGRLIETMLALPGMTKKCSCVRKTKKPRSAPIHSTTPDAKETGK